MKYDSVIIIFLLCVTFICALATSTYLVVNGHPWFAGFILLVVISARVCWGDDKTNALFGVFDKEDKKAKED